MTIPQRTLYVTDLDGTLLGADSLVSPESRNMLSRAIEAGAMFTVATARTPATVSQLLAGIPLQLPLIVMTGSTLWNPATGIYSESHVMSRLEAAALLSIYRRHNLPSFLFTLRDNLLHVYHQGPLSPREQEFVDQRILSPFKEFHLSASPLPEALHPLDKVMLLFAMQPSRLVERVYSEISSRPGCNPVFYHDMYGPDTGLMEVFAPEVSKAAAVERLRRLSGASRVVAFGDNINDIPMLRAADVAVAVGNAVPQVRDVASVVIGPNTDDSVARFILADLGLHP